MYELIGHENPDGRKKTSFSKLLSSGRNKQIKQRALFFLQIGPLTARQLSEKVPCMRSSVCGVLLKLSNSGIIDTRQSIYDNETNRNVTLYSLVESAKVTILSV
jgi:predicted transcriptional regulator